MPDYIKFEVSWYKHANVNLTLNISGPLPYLIGFLIKVNWYYVCPY